MKVLLSAYACEPNRGSEPGVGWHWALEIARLGHEVWVLTRANNKSVIENELSKIGAQPNLHFLYYDLPSWLNFWKKGPRGVRTYFVLWQWGAYRFARAEHRRYRFDRVHHITFGSIRLPSFMGNLGTEFIFGPVGGGERAPWRLRNGFGWRGYTVDALRDGLIWLVRFGPLMRRTFSQADSIYAKTPASVRPLPRRAQKKTKVHLEIGISGVAALPLPPEPHGLRLLFVGRLIYWKGMHVGLLAFEQVVRKYPDAVLTIVGSGPDKGRWNRLAQERGLSQRIAWVDWVQQSQLATYYRTHTALLFPSLHDSSGNVVLEALSHGLPVICLDLGGPGTIVNDSCGRVIQTAGRSEAQVVKGLATAITALHEDDSLRARLSEGARRRAPDFSWEKQVRALYEPGTTEAVS